jgi:hypothetical protein
MGHVAAVLRLANFVCATRIAEKLGLREPAGQYKVSQTAMTSSDKKMELAPSSETEARQREVQLLINIAQPDPEYQPFIVTDEASLLDAVCTEPDDIARRLSAYFGADLGLELRQPIWRIVDRIKRLRPGWPDDPGPS